VKREKHKSMNFAESPTATDPLPGPTLAYVGARLPSRSETFVYREVLGLRRRGWRVTPVSLRAPATDLGEQELNELASQALVVYRPGFWKAGLAEAIQRPGLALRSIAPAFFSLDTPLRKRPALIAQALGGLALAPELRDRGVEHVHAHMAHAPTAVAMVAARAIGAPFSFTGHAADLFRDRQNLRAKLRSAKFIACISHWHRDFYRQIVRRHKQDLPVIRCGVDVRQFNVARPPRGQTILAVGRLVEKKGFDTLLHAAAKLQSAGNCGEHLRLVLAGDGPERQDLERLARSLKLEHAVTFLGDTPNPRVRELLHEADLFVLPCRPTRSGDRDGIPVVLMEAMACGAPVISGDLVTIRELIEHERTGLLVPPDDPDALASAIDRLFSDREQTDRLADAGRRFVEAEFSLDTTLDRLEMAFRA